MEFRVVDFEKVTHHYKLYQDGVQKIEDYKDTVLKKVEPIRKEMQSILMAAQNGILMDAMSEQQRSQKFQSLQQELLSIDKDAKIQITEMRDELNKSVYSELEKLITNWSEENNIDVVIGKLEVVYTKKDYDVTDVVLDKLKSIGDYIEEEETVEYKGMKEREMKEGQNKFIIKES